MFGWLVFCFSKQQLSCLAVGFFDTTVGPSFLRLENLPRLSHKSWVAQNARGGRGSPQADPRVLQRGGPRAPSGQAEQCPSSRPCGSLQWDAGLPSTLWGAESGLKLGAPRGSEPGRGG